MKQHISRKLRYSRNQDSYINLIQGALKFSALKHAALDWRVFNAKKLHFYNIKDEAAIFWLYSLELQK
jgi:hypothetical protein